MLMGQRIRLARHAKGMSQMVLAANLGMTFQQVQKYEKGKNRVSASVLFELMRILQVPSAYFFDGYSTEIEPAAESAGATADYVEQGQQLFVERENVTLLQNYLRAPPAVRKAVRVLLSSVVKEDTHSDA